MRVSCPSCHQILVAPDNALGRKARCKGCGTLFVIEAAHVAPEAPASAAGSQRGFAVAPSAPDCPNCRTTMDPATVVCLRCGYNRQTGHVQIAPTPAPPPPDEDERTTGEKVLEFIGGFMPGLFQPVLVLISALLSLVGFAVIGLCVFIFFLGAVMEAAFIGGFGLIIYGQAIAIILQGEWGLLHELLAELDSRRWTLFFLLLFAPFVIMYFVLRPAGG